MQISISRRLAEAVGAWLHFEFCCYRAGLFSEASLKSAVGNVLSSFPIKKPGARVYSDFPHVALNPIRKPGRKKEVDFALILSAEGLPKEGAEILVEAKWLSSSHCTSKTIFIDFLRLAALKKKDKDATCIFLLAGTFLEMQKVVESAPFIVGGSGRNFGVGASDNQKKVAPSKLNLKHLELWGDSISDLLNSGFDIPASFVVQACDAYPSGVRESVEKFKNQNRKNIKNIPGGDEVVKNFSSKEIFPVHETVKFQARCWEILSVSNETLTWV